MPSKKRADLLVKAMTARMEGKVDDAPFVPDEWRWWKSITIHREIDGKYRERRILVGYSVEHLLHCGEEHEGKYGVIVLSHPSYIDYPPSLTGLRSDRVDKYERYTLYFRSFRKRKTAKRKGQELWHRYNKKKKRK